MNTLRDYLDYLDTPEWWTIRRDALDRAESRCERCGALGPFDAHHLSYARLGDEDRDDVEIVCRNCHRAELLPKNLRKRALERLGQQRLFDRWIDPDDDGGALALAA